MPSKCNSSAAYALLLSLGVKFVKIFENSAENTSILNVSFYSGARKPTNAEGCLYYTHQIV
jgi:hypothetical protein